MSDGDNEHDEEHEPLADLREDVERSREAETDDEFEELFTDVDVDNVDEEAVWAELSESADEPVADAVGVAEASGVEAETAEEVDRDVRVVEKRLCQGCEHFSDPPETACTHEGTTIEAEVDTDHFRVVNCPVVAAREENEASDFSGDEP
ncbi:hypothetical protein [Halobacterium noricense]|uniref:hypothetical protein n=1 Tax=Halobacterium noricense TaxID=223182 RepID=UPI001E2A352E|nr:hypothetical protein [Halobacterium noricense]UHH24720.1 hypothetical protein LT974_12115 [Halobacterium noricense]